MKTNNSVFRYGVPYMGSKSSIAEWVVAHLPRAKHFYDVFAGGCAVTHCAMRENKYEFYHLNDISDAPQLFVDAIKGKYANEKRWISRAMFDMYKATDPYIRLVWSFGNSGRNYMYGKDIEEYKHAMHAVIFGETVRERQLAVRKMVRELVKGDKGGHSIQSFQALQHLEHRNRLQSLQSLQSLQGFTSLVVSRMDYRELVFEDDCVIYCDPPYKGTTGYDGSSHVTNSFDHAAFYDWCEQQTHPIFISEYAMPEDRFVRIAKIRKRVLMCDDSTGAYAEEGLFVPHRWHKDIKGYEEKKLF